MMVGSPSSDHSYELADSTSEDDINASKTKRDSIVDLIAVPSDSTDCSTKFVLNFSCSHLERSGDDVGLSACRLGMTYRLQTTENRLFRIVMESHGFVEASACSDTVNVLWTGSHPKPHVWTTLQPYQRINHFPRSYELTRKDRLCRNIETMKYVRGAKHFDFIPPSFVMPHEYQEFCSAFLKYRGSWIVKPVASSRGRGIFLINHPDQLPTDEAVVVCKYIENPLLVDNHKCDVRLYVLVTSFDPLVVYLYEEGLVRFAALQYDSSEDSMCNPCVHLTNYSVNKFHSNFVQNGDARVDDVGNKWSLSALLRHLRLNGENTSQLMQGIEAIVIKSLLSVAPTVATACSMFVPHRNNCFELFGYDILIDSALRPWLLEVNLSPSLACDAPLDAKIKSALLCDLLCLVGVPAVSPVRSRARSRRVQTASGSRYKSRAPSLDSSLLSHGGVGWPSVSAAPFRRLTSDEQRVVSDVHHQMSRRGAFVCIMPTESTWSQYGCFLETCGSSLNLILHQHLFPPRAKAGVARRGYRRGRNSVHGSASTLSCSADRLARYERPLDRGCSRVSVESALSQCCISDPLQLEHSRAVCLNQVLASLQTGVQMSRYQARVAFSFYLQQVQKRFMASLHTTPDERQLKLVARFIEKAAKNLSEPHSLQMPSRSISPVERAILTAKQLGDFIHLYSKDTSDHVTAEDGLGVLDPLLHKRFVTGASESDLEHVLTLHTGLFQSADLFLSRPRSYDRPYTPVAGQGDANATYRTDQQPQYRLFSGNLLKTSLTELPLSTTSRRIHQPTHSSRH